MACGCHKNKNDMANVIADMKSAAVRNASVPAAEGSSGYVKQPEERAKPLDQCLFCAQKHADEAFVAMNEFTYLAENRSFVHGSLRSIVNHTFKDWPDIAKKARAAALLWQEAKFKESQDTLKEVITLIDETLLKENPEIQERIKEAEDAKRKQEDEGNKENEGTSQ